MERIAELEVQIAKLAPLVGIDSRLAPDGEGNTGFDGVTCDLELYPFTKSIIQTLKELDLFLQSLVDQSTVDVGVSMYEPAFPEQEVARLEKSVQRKTLLLRQIVTTLYESREKLDAIKTRHMQELYKV